MTSTYSATFTRYRGHERRISAPVHFNANDFRDAFGTAEQRLAGMRDADPESEFAIVSIGTTGYSGAVCNGVHMWETSEEAEKRLGEAQS